MSIQQMFLGSPPLAFSWAFAGILAHTADVTFTGGDKRTYFNGTPELQDGSNNVARFDHLLSDGTSLGLSVWRGSENGIRTNDMTGASAGTPGTPPNNWTSNANGTTQEIVAVGTTNGIATIDIRFSGTPSGNPVIRFETTTGISGVQNDAFNESAFIAIIAGDTTNIDGIRFQNHEYSVAPSFLSTNDGSDFKGDLTSTLQRVNFQNTLNEATVASVQPVLQIMWSSGDIDITLRIGLPMEEEGTGASPVIKTTNAAVTATADVATDTSPVVPKTWLVRARTPNASGTHVLGQYDDGDENERIRLVRNSSNEIRLFVTNGGVEQITNGLNLGTVANDTDFAVAVRIVANDFSGSLDGAAVVTDASGTVPTVTTKRLGRDSLGSYWNSTIALDAGWLSGLPDATLRTLAA